jgi:hypothetical protein
MDNDLRPFVPFVLVSAALGAFALAPRTGPPEQVPSVPITSGTDSDEPENAAARRADAPADTSDPAGVDAAALRGLWSRFPDAGGRDDTPVAFYYFHDDGIGLYRYGRIAYNTTNSYHWRVAGDDLELTWNKTGAVDRLDYRLDRSGPRPVLIVDEDPKNPGVRGSRYTFVPAPLVDAVAADLALAEGTTLSANHNTLDRIDNRLWIDLKKYATGGMGFALYQLRSQGIDGRGTGWHHVGDFDDWSTEQLTFKATTTADGRGTLELLFALRGERAVTMTTVGRRTDAGGQVQRTLTLQTDPRDFAAVHSFVDAGPSFASLRAWSRGGR